MKLILQITKNEFRNLFYSPVAWFVMIIFTIMCGFFYTEMMYPLAKATDMALKNTPTFAIRTVGSITQTYFSNPGGGYFVSVLQYLYLFVPLITMGIISREFNSGTYRLLFSSPVSMRQIVIGKYIAVMAYNLILMLILGIFIISTCFDIKSVDFMPLLSAVLGIYLLLCAFSSIGLFMSSLTNYQIVSAIASFTVLFILNMIGGLWQEYDFVRDLTYFLSINDRTEKMIGGLITSKDIIYYLLIIFMFVSFTLFRFKAMREIKPWYLKSARYILVVLSVLLLGYISSRPRFTGYWDTTARKTNTLHPRTQEILKELGNDPLEVVLYANLFDKVSAIGFPAARNKYLSMLWEPYQRFKKDMIFRFEYYYALMPGDSSYYKRFPGKNLEQIAQLIAKGSRLDFSLFKSPEEIKKIINLEPEYYSLIARLKYKGKTEFLRIVGEPESEIGGVGANEKNVNAAIKRLLGTKMPKIAFVSGELERNIYKTGEREFIRGTIIKGRQGSLINVGFDADTLNLTTQEITGDITTLVLADPKMRLTDTVMRKINSYLDGGGNMLIMGEPGKQYVLNPLLQKLGIKFNNGQLVQITPNETPDKVIQKFSFTTIHLADEYFFRYYKYLNSQGVIETPPDFIMPGILNISYVSDSGYTIRPLTLTQSGRTWLENGRLVTDSVPPIFNPQEGDIKDSSFVTAMTLTKPAKGKEQRIAVIGDADVASNLRLVDDYIRSLYSWLNYNQFPIYTHPAYAKDNLILLKPKWAAVQKTVYVWILPGLLLMTSVILLVRRSRK